MRTDEAEASTSNTHGHRQAGSIGAFVIACIAGIFITRGHIDTSQKRLRAAARRIAAGDLTVNVAVGDHLPTRSARLAQKLPAYDRQPAAPRFAASTKG